VNLPPYIPSFLRFVEILHNRSFLLPGDLTDLFRALSSIDLTQRKQVYLALKAVLLLEQEREEEFRRIFDSFFTSLPPLSERDPFSASSPSSSPDPSPEIDPLSLWELLKEVSRSIGLWDQTIPLGEGYTRYKLLKKLEEEGVLAEISRNFPEGEQELLQEIRKFVEEFVRKEFRFRELCDLPPPRQDFWERSFYHIAPDELPRILKEVERIAMRLKHLYGRRLQRAHRGRIHLPRTLRKNWRTQEVLFNLELSRPRLQKFELFIFVDVSASVRTASSFMLTLTYAFRELFRRVRSFAFVTRCVEITELMDRLSLSRFIQEIMEGKVLDIWEDSDYGAFLDSIEEDLRGAISPRTTILILGDARSNYHDPHIEQFRELARRSRALLWFNPEPQGSWGFGDSVIHSYAPYCSAVAPVGNLRMLIEAVDQHLIPRVLKKPHPAFSPGIRA